MPTPAEAIDFSRWALDLAFTVNAYSSGGAVGEPPLSVLEHWALLRRLIDQVRDHDADQPLAAVGSILVRERDFALLEARARLVNQFRFEVKQERSWKKQRAAARTSESDRDSEASLRRRHAEEREHFTSQRLWQLHLSGFLITEAHTRAARGFHSKDSNGRDLRPAKAAEKFLTLVLGEATRSDHVVAASRRIARSHRLPRKDLERVLKGRRGTGVELLRFTLVHLFGEDARTAEQVVKHWKTV